MSRRARVGSWLVDYLVVLAWLLVVFVLVGVPTLLGWVDLSAVWSREWAADLAVTVLTVLPYLGYLVLTEAGPRHATWGKRRAGLAVAAARDRAAPPRRDGSNPPQRTSRPDPPGLPGVVVRNLVKVLPWQLGHMSAMRFAVAGDDIPVDAVVLYVASTAVLLAVALPPLLGRRGLHEVLGGTRVQRSGTLTPRRPASPAAPS